MTGIFGEDQILVMANHLSHTGCHCLNRRKENEPMEIIAAIGLTLIGSLIGVVIGHLIMILIYKIFGGRNE
jgi:hypothetical protein